MDLSGTMSQARGGESVVSANGAPEGGGTVSEVDAPSDDDLFDLLSNQRRRYALHYLKQRGEVVELRDVAEQVAAWEYHSTVRELDRRERKRVQTALHQFHFPKMDDVGVVEYDAHTGRVRPASASSDLECYLDVVSGEERSWSGYYLLLSALCTAMVAFAWAGLPPLAAVPAWGWAGTVPVAFGAFSVAHAHHRRSRRLGADGPPPETVQ